MKLLAILVGAKSVAACLDAAAAATRALPEASVEALHVVIDPENMIAPPDEIELQRLLALSEGNAQQRAAATRSAFIAWCNRAGHAAAGFRWKALIGPEEQTICDEAASADVILLVLAHEARLASGDALHAAIFRSGKPVLLVPPGWQGRGAGFRHVAVALSNSDATRHAIEGAGPWLRAADRVTAIHIGTREDAPPGLSRLLSEMGAEPSIHTVPRGHADLGEQLVMEADAIGADLLVSGAYRHAELLEWLLGGTTRHLLATADLPLLLAH